MKMAPLHRMATGWRRVYGLSVGRPAWKRPRYYAIAWWEYDLLTAVAYPIGLHLVMRWLHRRGLA